MWCCLCDPTFSRRLVTDRHRAMANTADAQHRAVKIEMINNRQNTKRQKAADRKILSAGVLTETKGTKSSLTKR